ncbi:hypothetical protein JXB22_07005 [candidate division WOR-3 bacterium]|nr:hypothetical protein [candidate division WOR-3 bacterium]
MHTILLILLLSQTSGHDIGEEVIKGEAEMKIQDRKIALNPELKPFAPLDSIISQERYIFDEKLYATIDALNTPILYLHSEYLRVPLVSRFMYSSIALFVPRFEKTVASWELLITDTNGDVVRKYAERGLPPPSISWDGRTEKNEMCNMGETYNYVFTAFDAVGNPTRISGRSYKFNGIVYDEQRSKIIAVASSALFSGESAALNAEAPDYLDEVANVIKDNFKKEVVVFSYSQSEALAKSRGAAVMNEIIERVVLPEEGIKTAPRFIPGLEPKYSKIEIVVQ